LTIQSSIDFGVSRRRLLGTSGAALIGAAVPLWKRAAAAAAHYDIVVVGGGTAGMMLAIFAAQRKAKILVIEKSPVAGGTLPLSGGKISASGTVFQKEKGIVDTPDLQYADNMRISHNTADPALTRLFVDNAGKMTDWLASLGYKLTGPNYLTADTGHEAFSVPRYHWSADSGKGIFKIIGPVFDDLVATGRVTLQLNTGVVDLLQEKDGKVLGVVTEQADGARREEFGRSIVLASGGCAGNPAMFYDLHKVPLYAQYAYAYSQGMGLTLGEAAGGFLWGQGKYLPQFGTILASDATPSPSVGGLSLNPATRPPWEIYVNAEGNRFVKEDEMDNALREVALRDQTGQRFWVVFDQNAMDNAPPLISWPAEKYRAAFNTQPMFTSGADLRELAIKAGVQPINLANSVAAYNGALAGGAADPLGRASRPAPIAKGPFYAIRNQGWTPTSTVGLAVDGELRVVTRTGAPIPNLYAAGEVIGAGATMGDAFVGGAILTPALTFGRLLGERILKI
jgi:fumarate reductase flavoprotein subunit